MIRKLALFALLLIALSGCRIYPEAPSDLKAEEAFQRVANALPALSHGVAEPPAIIRLTRSNKVPPAPDPKDVAVFCNETVFHVRFNSLVTRRFAVPWDAVTAIEVNYRLFPSAIYWLIAPILQAWDLRIVVDTTKAPELKAQVEKDIRTLKEISREIQLPAPFYHAEQLEQRLRDMESDWGRDRFELRLSRHHLGPPWVPVPRDMETLGEAFARAREAAREQAATPGEKP